MKKTALAKFLEIAGISDTDFAQKIRVTPGYVNLIKHGRRVPSAKIAHRIRKETGLPMEDIFTTQEGR